MKLFLRTSLLFIFSVACFNVYKAQTVFLQNFEAAGPFGFLNNGETQLINGPSPCGKASRGTTTDFNSAGVNFKSSQNASHFLGVNPQSPCGGFYTASLKTDSIAVSMTDSLVFKCRYFISSSLKWGPASLQFTFTNGTKSYTINTSNTPKLADTANWTNFTIGLPASIKANYLTIKIDQMGGGEAVGIDDIEVSKFGTGSGIQVNNNLIQLDIFPNPFKNTSTLTTQSVLKNGTLEIYDLVGKKVKVMVNLSGNKIVIDRELLPNGVYFVRLMDENNCVAILKMIVD